MVGYLFLAGFLACGFVIMNRIMFRKSLLIRLWLGLCAGLMLMMWLPIPFAYFLTFNRASQLLALGTAALFALGTFFLPGKARLFSHEERSFCGDLPVILLLTLLLPLTILSGCLQYTHILRDVGGALHVGQSTYGDLCLHLGIAEGAVNAVFPFEYTILPGTLLGYPFLSDTLVTSMILFGTPTASAFVVTGTIMMALVYLGFIIFAWELTHRKAVVILAFLLMFINGGLGFLYTFDGVFRDPSMLKNVFTGFYQTPTNIPDLNLRWVNVICDMMIPQRTLLGGWTMLLPSFYLLLDARASQNRFRFVLLGIWAGLIPMVHTHSFFALGLMSAGVMIYSLIHTGNIRRTLICYLCYAAAAILLALPQLLKWTFPQTVGGGSLAFRFNWVNNQGNGRLIDGYFWFWIKNVGLAYIFMIPAALHAPKGGTARALALGALVIYAAAELIQFQPNPYDNNKLFYVAYMLMLPAVSDYMIRLFQRMKGLRGRALLAALFVIVMTLSGSLSLAREVVSDYRLFSADEAAAADYIRENIPRDSVFLTGDEHNNVVAALTGRKIVCGTGSYLYYHGIDYSAQAAAERAMLADPEHCKDMFDAYHIDYVFISDAERKQFNADEAWFDEHCPLLKSFGNVRIYRYPRETYIGDA